MSRMDQLVKPGAIVLTDARVHRTAVSCTPEIMIADAVRRGLPFPVRATRSKTQMLPDGKQRRTALGLVTTISVAEARQLAAGSTPAPVDTTGTSARTAPLLRTEAPRSSERYAVRCKPSFLRSFDPSPKTQLLRA